MLVAAAALPKLVEFQVVEMVEMVSHILLLVLQHIMPVVEVEVEL
jgi:hypothetical protein